MSASDEGAVDGPDVTERERLWELLAAATPGPWRQEPDTMAGRVWVSMDHRSDLEPNTRPAIEGRPWDPRRLFNVRTNRDQVWDESREEVFARREADAALIAAAVNALPALLDALDAADARVAAAVAPEREQVGIGVALGAEGVARHRAEAAERELDEAQGDYEAAAPGTECPGCDRPECLVCDYRRRSGEGQPAAGVTLTRDDKRSLAALYGYETGLADGRAEGAAGVTEAVLALADEWEEWSRTRSTPRIDAFRDAAERIRAAVESATEGEGGGQDG